MKSRTGLEFSGRAVGQSGFLWSFSHPKSSGLKNERTEPELRHKTLKVGSLQIFNERFPRWWNSMHVCERRITLPIFLYSIQTCMYGTCLCCPLCHSSMPKRSKWLDHAKFCANRSRRCGDMAIFDFSRWRPSAILNLLYACLDHPRSVFWWSLSLCKTWFESVQQFR